MVKRKKGKQPEAPPEPEVCDDVDVLYSALLQSTIASNPSRSKATEMVIKNMARDCKYVLPDIAEAFSRMPVSHPARGSLWSTTTNTEAATQTLSNLIAAFKKISSSSSSSKNNNKQSPSSATSAAARDSVAQVGRSLSSVDTGAPNARPQQATSSSWSSLPTTVVGSDDQEDDEEENQKQFAKLQNFFDAKRLGYDDKYGVRCYQKAAYVLYKSQPQVMKEFVENIKPRLIVTRTELDTVDKRGRKWADWNSSHGGRSWTIDEKMKVMTFFGRMSFWLQQKYNSHRDIEEEVMLRFRYLTVACELPYVGKQKHESEQRYTARDNGVDQFWMLRDLASPGFDTNYCPLAGEKIPMRVRLFVGDGHATNWNTFWIIVDELIRTGVPSLRIIAWVRNCFQHVLSTSLLEGSAVLCTLMDCTASCWVKRVVLTAKHLGSSMGQVHEDLQSQMDRGIVLTKQRGVTDSDRGRLEKILRFLNQGKHVDRASGFELCRGKVVYDVDWHEANAGVLTDEKWLEIQDRGQQLMHDLFTRPKAGASNKWFTIGENCRGRER